MELIPEAREKKQQYREAVVNPPVFDELAKLAPARGSFVPPTSSSRFVPPASQAVSRGGPYSPSSRSTVLPPKFGGQRPSAEEQQARDKEEEEKRWKQKQILLPPPKPWPAPREPELSFPATGRITQGWVVPELSDMSCSSAVLKKTDSIAGLGISHSDTQHFALQPLAALDLGQFVCHVGREDKGKPQIDDKLPFDVSNHPYVRLLLLFGVGSTGRCRCAVLLLLRRTC